MHKKDPLMLLAFLVAFVESWISTNSFLPLDYRGSIKQNGGFNLFVPW